MNSKTLVTRIALLVVGFSLLSTIFWGIFVGSRGLVGNIVRLVINVVLAFFLLAGHSWARWVMAIRYGIATITSFASWSALAQSDFSFFSVIRLWLLASAIFAVAIGGYLVLSKRVNEHFTPSSGF